MGSSCLSILSVGTAGMCSYVQLHLEGFSVLKGIYSLKTLLRLLRLCMVRMNNIVVSEGIKKVET